MDDVHSQYIRFVSKPSDVSGGADEFAVASEEFLKAVTSGGGDEVASAGDFASQLLMGNGAPAKKKKNHKQDELMTEVTQVVAPLVGQLLEYYTTVLSRLSPLFFPETHICHV